jgi:hypothetical protein
MTDSARLDGGRPERRVPVALAVALALACFAAGIVLSRSPLVVVGTNQVPPAVDVEFENGSATASTCQLVGTIPRGTSAIRLAIEVRAVGPAVSLTVLSGSHLISVGQKPTGWASATSATVAIAPIVRTVDDARVCIKIGPTAESFRVRGARVNPRVAEVKELSEIRFAMSYLRPGSRSWFSLASSVATHMGLGNAAGGPWIAYLALALMVVVATLACLLALRTLDAAGQAGTRTLTASRTSCRARQRLQRVPRGAWVCALIAVANAACWSLITPPFQVPDEPSHFAYTQSLVENQRLPTSNLATFSQEELAVLIDLHHEEVRGSPETNTISSVEEQRQLESVPDEHLSRHPEGAGGAATYPPLYYALEAVPYVLSSGGTLLDQLEAMRLFSALMAGITAFFAFLFVAEVLPSTRWAWTVGGLGVAVAPLLGFMSGAVNPDAMLFAVSAAIFYCLARGFHRGPTWRLAAVIGVLAAVGLLTKPNFYGMLPGILLALVVLSSRAQGARAGARFFAVAVLIAASPVCVYALANLRSGRPALGVLSATLSSGTGSGSLLDRASYIWQFYLPRLPGMHDYFPGLSTLRQLWFDRSVGLYGWLDTTFPVWVDTLALILVGLLGLLCARSLLENRAQVRRRIAELAVYAAVGVGLLALIGATSYLDAGGEGLSTAEPRYLAPLLPLFACVLALAARGAGRRWGPALGVVIVVLLLAHDVFSQLLVVGRYYA